MYSLCSKKRKNILAALSVGALFVFSNLPMRQAEGQETVARTTVRCRGSFEYTINFVPRSRSGYEVAKCRPPQETWYDNFLTQEWKYFTTRKGVFVIRINKLYFGPIAPGSAIDIIEADPDDASNTPPQVIYKVGTKTVVLNARAQAEAMDDLEHGKVVTQ